MPTAVGERNEQQHVNGPRTERGQARDGHGRGGGHELGDGQPGDGRERGWTLAGVEARLASVDLGRSSDDELIELTGAVHWGRRRIEGYLTRLSAEANRREAAGRSGPASDTMRAGGEVPAKEAERLAQRGRIGTTLPQLGGAAEEGTARPANADVAAEALERLSESERRRLQPFDAEISSRAASLPPETFAKWLRKLLARIEDPDQPSEAESEKARSSVRMGRRADGRWWLAGDLDAERGAAIHAALAARASELVEPGQEPTPAIWAEALYQLLGGQTEGGGVVPVRLGIGYVVDARTLFDGLHGDTVAQTWGGEHHDPNAVRRLACDADWYGAAIDPLGRVTRVGRARRRATRELRMALRALYPGCPLDGTPFDRCEIHHVTFYEHGGSTDLDNLVPVSSAWHHRLHDRGWRLVMHPDRSLDLYRPDGTHHRALAPPPPLAPQRE
jgi:hypothetical protein